MAKRTLSVEETWDIIYGLNDRYSTVLDEIDDTSRWAIHSTIVVMDENTGKYWSTHYSVGATETQEDEKSPHPEYDKSHEWEEVEPKIVSVTKYVPV